MLRSHVIPAVLGPKKRIYIVDDHVISARALLEESAPYAGVYILQDLSHLEKDEFWIFLIERIGATLTMKQAGVEGYPTSPSVWWISRTIPFEAS